MRKTARLADRAVLAVAGPDRTGYLQGLVSNDVAAVTADRAIWAALLTPQGKYLADFFVCADGERLLLDCERAMIDAIAQKLARLRLRARVEIAPTRHVVFAVWDGAPEADALAFADPRHPSAGHRVLTEPSSASLVGPGTDGADQDDAGTEDASAYDRHRLMLGLPDGTRDLEPDRSVLLEAGFDELNGISWTKGCYMGQELTARTRYRGLIKRRLVPVSSDHPLPPPGTILTVGAGGREAGTMRSSRDELGLATIRLESLHEELHAGDAVLRARVPDWLRLPAPAASP